MAKKGTLAQRWQNRIVGHADVDPTTLVPNPKNWRKHGQQQQAVMRGLLGDLGWLEEILVNQRTGNLINGHMRLGLALEAKEPTVPVKYVDLDEADEAKALATFDPVAALFEMEVGAYRALLDDVKTGDAAVMQMVSEQAGAYAEAAPASPPEDFQEYDEDIATEDYCCPKCGYEWSGKAK
jgi:hypothetical protein